MKSLKDLLTPGASPKAPTSAQQARAVSDAAGGRSGGESPLLDPEVQGVDARRLADLKAEEAGRRWRREAEAKGEKPKETGGPQGLEPTRYGDWEKAGRCYDF
jgi:hypothetical protein